MTHFTLHLRCKTNIRQFYVSTCFGTFIELEYNNKHKLCVRIHCFRNMFPHKAGQRNPICVIRSVSKPLFVLINTTSEFWMHKYFKIARIPKTNLLARAPGPVNNSKQIQKCMLNNNNWERLPTPARTHTFSMTRKSIVCVLVLFRNTHFHHTF